MSSEKPIPEVPPGTPNEEFYFDLQCDTFEVLDDKLDNFNIPIIRDIGVKQSLQHLANYFNFPNFSSNFSQFWIVDILAECIWRTQDEYFFPVEFQRIILRWVIYAFNLIRNEEHDRKDVFRIFNEAIAIAENNVKNGEPLTTPDKLFTIEKSQDLKPVSSHISVESQNSSSPSSMSLSSKDSEKSYIALEFDEKTEIFNIQENLCFKSLECLSTDVTTPSEIHTEEVLPTIQDVADEVIEESSISDIDLNQMFMTSSSEILLRDRSSEDLMSPFAGMQSTCEPVPKTTLQIAEEETLKAWIQYQIWQLHLEQMLDHRKGWLDSNDSIPVDKIGNQTSEITENDFIFWKTFLNKFNEIIAEKNQIIFVNLCAIMAIKELVLDYFYESFQFIMTKILFQSPHYYLTQKINNTWSIPKRLKTEIKRPAKRKPPKPPKVKKKKEKGSKKSSKKSKKSKSSKSSKKSKKSDKSKKGKGKDKGKLTKEEKERLAQLQREQELLEEEMRLKAENAIFMFPLADATNDEFYQKHFENWVRPVTVEKTKKKGKKAKK